MAANPKVISAMHIMPKEEATRTLESKPTDVKQRILDLLIKIFHGHEDFLGRTPD
jgi:hypothetical protein